MANQIIIKVILLLAFGLLAVLLLVPRPHTRGRAVRRIMLVLLLLAAVVFVIMPEWLTSIAHLVGIGRGTDLVLYALVVLVVGNMVAARRTAISQNRDITQLARNLAITQAPDPNELFGSDSDES
ncbi:DUF2304 domain-containing protein [Propionibacterium australiense]|nr:DUF2304 domain-containing protein [Propionibacterium australiense]SYZ32515.1 Protein of unknown function DUF2304 [Propionibacterium australiense]VEH88786.1 Uncharacterized conserved protein [Propionibacterium australiense]